MTYECKKIVFTPALQSYKAMIWATQGAVFFNSNFDEITSNLRSYKAMMWATPGAVFSNICLEIGITVGTEDKPTIYLFSPKVQQCLLILLDKDQASFKINLSLRSQIDSFEATHKVPHSIHAPSEIITTYDEMFEARAKDKDTIFSIRVAKVHGDDCKV